MGLDPCTRLPGYLQLVSWQKAPSGKKKKKKKKKLRTAWKAEPMASSRLPANYTWAYLMA